MKGNTSYFTVSFEYFWQKNTLIINLLMPTSRPSSYPFQHCRQEEGMTMVFCSSSTPLSILSLITLNIINMDRVNYLLRLCHPLFHATSELWHPYGCPLITTLSVFSPSFLSPHKRLMVRSKWLPPDGRTDGRADGVWRPPRPNRPLALRASFALQELPSLAALPKRGGRGVVC